MAMLVYRSVLSWERSHIPFPAGSFESMKISFSRLVGYVNSLEGNISSTFSIRKWIIAHRLREAKPLLKKDRTNQVRWFFVSDRLNTRRNRGLVGGFFPKMLASQNMDGWKNGNPYFVDGWFGGGKTHHFRKHLFVNIIIYIYIPTYSRRFRGSKQNVGL